MFLGDDRLASLQNYVHGVFNYCEIKPGARELRFLRAFGAWQYQTLIEEHPNLDPYSGAYFGGAFWCLVIRSDRAGEGREPLASEFFLQIEEFLRQSGYEAGLHDERLDLGEFISK